MFMVNEWLIAVIISGVILGLWVIVFVLSEIWKYSWAWIDDSKPEKDNFIYKKLTKIIKTEWIYPVFLTEGTEPFGYAKDKKWNNAKIHDYGKHDSLLRGIDYLYDSDKRCKNIIKLNLLPLLSIPLPILFLITIKFYVIFSVIGSIVLTAYLSRFTRRLSKKYKLHVEDKAIHVQKEGE